MVSIDALYTMVETKLNQLQGQTHATKEELTQHIDERVQNSLTTKSIVKWPILAGAIMGTLQFGPIDFARTIYNTATGDSPALKHELVDFARQDMKRNYPLYSARDIEVRIAAALYTSFPDSGERVDPAEASMSRIFDLAEKGNWISEYLWTGADGFDKR